MDKAAMVTVPGNSFCLAPSRSQILSGLIFLNMSRTCITYWPSLIH